MSIQEIFTRVLLKFCKNAKVVCPKLTLEKLKGVACFMEKCWDLTNIGGLG